MTSGRFCRSRSSLSSCCVVLMTMVMFIVHRPCLFFTVCAVTVGMGVWMIVRTNGQLKKPAESKQSKEATDCERP